MGGRGTAYTAAYSGKPVIDITNITEQQYNLDCLILNMAIRLSKKYIRKIDFINAIEKIFTNYDIYLQNARNLANKLPKPEGNINAACRLVEFLA